MKVHTNGRTAVVAQPLYAQVRERLLERIVSKEWQQGQVLPNEFDLARQFGVSIGTIRKAVEGLEAAKIVVRKQGRGTFVSRESAAPHTDPVSLFGQVGVDESTVITNTLAIEQRPAIDEEARGLSLTGERGIIQIKRRRTFAGTAVVFDRICLPQRLFFDLEPQQALPGNLYEFYGDYFGIRAVKCREHVSAVSAAADVQTVLGLPAQAAILRIERTSFSAAGDAIEWRESFCRLPHGIGVAGAC